MDGEIAAAGIEQNAALDAAIDRGDRGARLDGHARRGLRIRSGALTGRP